MAIEIPLQPLPNQTVRAVLGGQNAQIYSYSRDGALYCDININGVDVVTGIKGLNAVPLVASTNLVFVGQLAFYDKTGKGQDPKYSGLGTTWGLFYVEVV
jgi:hypothetical protein